MFSKHLYVMSCVPRLLLSCLTPFNVIPIRKESFRTNRTNSNLQCSGSHVWYKLTRACDRWVCRGGRNNSNLEHVLRRENCIITAPLNWSCVPTEICTVP